MSFKYYVELIDSLCNECKPHYVRKNIRNLYSNHEITLTQKRFLRTRMFYNYYKQGVIPESHYNPYWSKGFINLHNDMVYLSGNGYYIYK